MAGFLAALSFLGRYGWMLAVAAGLIWARHQGQASEDRRLEITSLKLELQAEKDARRRDVGGLENLRAGDAKASAAHVADKEVLVHVFNSIPPSPLQPGLAGFMRCLRLADAGTPCDGAAAGVSDGTVATDATRSVRRD